MGVGVWAVGVGAGLGLERLQLGWFGGRNGVWKAGDSSLTPSIPTFMTPLMQGFQAGAAATWARRSHDPPETLRPTPQEHCIPNQPRTRAARSRAPRATADLPKALQKPSRNPPEPLNSPPKPLSHPHLCRLADLVDHVPLQPVELPLLRGRLAPQVVVLVGLRRGGGLGLIPKGDGIVRVSTSPSKKEFLPD